MTDAVCYQQSLDTLQRLCFHSPTSFRGYLSHQKKLCYCFNPGFTVDFPIGLIDHARGPTRSGLQLPQSCAGVLWAESWVVGMPEMSRDDSSSFTGPKMPGGGRLGGS